MLWWWPVQDNAFFQAMPLLTSLTGTAGEKFTWTLTGNRTVQEAARTFVVRMPPNNVVIVANKEPLSVGIDGASLFMDKFKLLRGDLEAAIEGTDFYIGENMLVRLGKLKLRQLVIGEFCEIRWVAWGSSEPSGAYDELVRKLSLPSNRKELHVDFVAVNDVPFDERHTALQIVVLYEEAMAARS